MVALPKIPLTDWQRTFLEDDSQFVFVAATRQSGKSDGLSKKSTLASLDPRPNLDVILSRGERQSLEVMEKIKTQCRALNVAMEPLTDFFRDTSLLQHTITFPNGNRIIGLPANPDTARGYTGNLRLDEFALHKDSREIWAAAAPIATRGYKITVCSTFKGTENKFYEIAKLLNLHDGIRPERQPVRANGWSGHWVDIYMSAEQTRRALGIEIDVEGLHRAIDDEEVWLQEFCNVPISGAEQFIPTDLVLACESEEAALEWDGSVVPGLGAGMDIGRVKDRSVIVVGAPIADLAVVRGVIGLERMPFAEQRKIAREVAAAVMAGGGRFPIDATGIGTQFAEELRDEFPCVEAVNFASRVESGARNTDGETISVPVKERMAVAVKKRMEEHTLRLPESPRLRRACSAIKRVMGATGQMRFDAARTDQGHADEFWALALWLAGMETARSYVPITEGGLMGRPVMGGLLERVF